jgi:hypothetical protein
VARLELSGNDDGKSFRGRSALAKVTRIHELGEERLSLFHAAELILDECRMVLPGIQAIFGFQLIAVFNSGFKVELTPVEQRLHLAAIVLVVLATAILMTPAAYHRQTGPRQLTSYFITLATRLLLLGMAPLALGISIDVFLIARIILGTGMVASLLSALLLVAIAALWFVLPRAPAMQRILSGSERA